MAFLHSASGEALRSELDLWSLPPTQLSIEGGSFIPYKPIASLDQANTVEFCIPGSGSEYLDVAHLLLYVKVKIVNVDGKDFTADDKNDAAFVNYPMHSIWSQADLSLNQKTITQSSMTHPYRCYKEALLAFDTPAKNSHMTMRAWYRDTPGKMNAYTGDDNTGLAARRALGANSQHVEFLGPIHTDLCNQEKFLLNQVELRLKLTRGRDAFALMSTNKNEKIVLLDATLYARKVRLSPSVLLAHAAALEQAPAKYSLTRVDLKTCTISAGLQDKTIDNLHLGQVPKRIIIGFVSNEAYNGSYRHNPFNFEHFNLSYLSLHVDAQQIPAQPLTPDYDRKTYMDAYNTLFAGTGIHWKDEGNGISHRDYPLGYTLYCFDLTPDLSAHEAHWNLQRQGVVRLDIRFKKGLDHAVNCIVFSEFSNLIEIDKNRSVTVDYGV